MSDEQQLNSLNRFRKQSPRLVLEEHGHCEIPAGCGGVVLRWRDPRAAVPVSVFLHSPNTATVWINGVELRFSHTDIAIGRQVVALALDEVDLSSGLFLFAANHNADDYRRGEPTESSDRPLTIVSAADGTWKFSLAEPPTEWIELTFDDSDWPALELAPTPQLANSDRGYYACRRCTEFGAVCLGLPAEEQPKRAKGWLRFRPGRQAQRGKIWIRKVIDIPAPEESSPWLHAVPSC